MLRFSPILKISVAVIPLLASVSALAQSLTMQDVLKGEKLPQSIKINELPADFKAMKIVVAGASDLGGLMSPFMMLGMMFSSMGGDSGNSEQNKIASLMSASELSWTKGDIVQMYGAEYLVTYKMPMSMMDLMTADKNKGPSTPTELKLSLVRTSSINEISPSPNMTPDKLSKILSEGVQGGSSNTVDSPANQTTALSNAKQIALGMIMYTSDYDDVYPYVQGTKACQFVTFPYIKNISVWETHNPNGSQFQFNMSLAGSSMAEVEFPAETPMYFESVAWPDSRRVVAFSDGHAKIVTEAEWQGMQKYLKMSLKKSAKPFPINYGMDWTPPK